MSLINEIADMIAAERGHTRTLCNDKCHCYRLACDIVALTEVAHAARLNATQELLDQRTTEIQRLRRFVGE